MARLIFSTVKRKWKKQNKSIHMVPVVKKRAKQKVFRWSQ